MFQYSTHLQMIARSRRASQVFSTLLAVLLVFTVCTGIVFAAPSTDDPLKKQAKRLVHQGVTLYKQKDFAGAQKALEQAEALVPDNYAVPYYLGLIYLEKKQRAEAISQWQRYLRLDPYSDNANHIRKLLTLLLCEEATEKAKLALAQEATLVGVQADDNSLAITAYQNLGSAHLKTLGKGMAAMLISDLAKVPDLQVVDRIELQALIQEMKLGTSGLVDTQTAPRVGHLLKVSRVSTGSLADIEKEQIQVAAVTVDAGAKEALGSQDVRGHLDDFFKLEKQIACGILESLGKTCDTAPKSFHRVHTKSLPAFVAFSEGLDSFDNRQYGDARKQFQQALQEDPEFDLAQEALAATPLATMLQWNTSQIISSASAKGVPAAAATSATASSAATGSAAAGTAVAGGTGLSATTIAVAGGVAVVGAVALAGGGGDSDDGAGPTNVPELAGDWNGAWRSTASGAAGDVSLRLNQDKNRLSGTISLSGSTCFSSAAFDGTVSSNSVSLEVSYDSGSAHLEGSTSNDGSMQGVLRFNSGECAGQESEINCQLLSSTDITW